MSIKESEKYRAEVFKTWSFLFGTPFGMLVLSLFLTEFRLSWGLFIKFCVAMIFLFVKALLIEKGRAILEAAELVESRDYERRIN